MDLSKNFNQNWKKKTEKKKKKMEEKKRNSDLVSGPSETETHQFWELNSHYF